MKKEMTSDTSVHNNFITKGEFFLLNTNKNSIITVVNRIIPLQILQVTFKPTFYGYVFLNLVLLHEEVLNSIFSNNTVCRLTPRVYIRLFLGFFFANLIYI